MLEGESLILGLKDLCLYLWTGLAQHTRFGGDVDSHVCLGDVYVC